MRYTYADWVITMNFTKFKFSYSILILDPCFRRDDTLILVIPAPYQVRGKLQRESTLRIYISFDPV